MEKPREVPICLNFDIFHYHAAKSFHLFVEGVHLPWVLSSEEQLKKKICEILADYFNRIRNMKPAPEKLNPNSAKGVA